MSNQIHVIPNNDIIEHQCTHECECRPRMLFRNPMNEREVWLHKRIGEKENKH